jgi:hypothetical protein
MHGGRKLLVAGPLVLVVLVLTLCSVGTRGGLLSESLCGTVLAQGREMPYVNPLSASGKIDGLGSAPDKIYVTLLDPGKPDCTKGGQLRVVPPSAAEFVTVARTSDSRIAGGVLEARAEHFTLIATLPDGRTTVTAVRVSLP